MTPGIDTPLLNSILLGLASLAGAGLWLRRRLSRDSTEIAKDRAETGIVSRLQAEHDAAVAEARAARAQRDSDVRTIALLEAQRDSLQREVDRLAADFAALKRTVRRLSPEMQHYLGTDFGELDPRK